jgi:hypothetical protein
MTISPDGRQLAFAGKSPTKRDILLWIRSMDAIDPRPIPGTEGSFQLPFWSPDSKSIGFFADGKLKRVDVASGVVQEIADAPDGRGGAWSRNGTIVFAPDLTGPLYRVASTGSAAMPLTELAKMPPEQGHRFPSFLPDGVHFVFTVYGADENSIAIASLDGTTKTVLMKLAAHETTQALVSGDFLLCVRAGALLAQRLDRKRWQLVGDALPVASGVDKDDGPSVYMGRDSFTVSADGLLVYRPRSPTADFHQLTWMTRGGRTIKTLWDAGPIYNVSLSPDGRRAAVDRQDPRSRVIDSWIVDADTGAASRLTRDRRYVDRPIWSFDGNRLFFSFNPRPGLVQVYGVSADGSGSEELVLEAATALVSTTDGALVLAMRKKELRDSDGDDLWSYVPGRDRQPTLLFDGWDRNDVRQASVSADGHFVAYSTLRDVFVQALPSGPRLQVARRGDFQAVWPTWRPDGGELYYRMFGKLMAVDVRRGASIELGTPKPLFDIPENAYGYAATADGQRFLIAMPAPTTSAPAQPIVVLNWSAPFDR